MPVDASGNFQYIKLGKLCVIFLEYGISIINFIQFLKTYFHTNSFL